MIPQVYVAARPVAALAPVGDLTIRHSWPAAGIGGPVGASFSLLLPAAKRPAWLVKEAPAEVRVGGWPILSGSVAEVDWIGGKIDIDGAALEGGTTACLTAAGNTSSTPETILDAAIARGALTWSRPASISTTALTDGDETAQLNSVTDMLARYADENDARLYVDPSRRLLEGTDPTTPSFIALPGSGELAWASEKQADAVIGRWYSSSGALNNTIVGSGAIEQIVDLTNSGILNTTRATEILKSILRKATAGGWANGLTLTSADFAGRPHLAAVADQVGRGMMLRLLGQRDPREGRAPVGFVDVVVESSEWNVSEGTISLDPRGIVARDFASILAEAGVKEAV